MKDLQRFVKIGEERINLEEIVSYGIAVDEDDERYLFVETKTSEDLFQYYEENLDCDLDEKITALDELLLIRKLGHVDFE